MASATIDADTTSIQVTGSQVDLLPFVGANVWAWGDGQEILWGDGEEIFFSLAYLRNWDTISSVVTPSDISATIDYAIDADTAPYVINGSDVLLSAANFILEADSTTWFALGSYPIFNLPLIKDSVIDADAAEFNITESDVTLQYSAQVVIDADTATWFAFPSFPVVLLPIVKDWLVNADTDAYEVTGLDIELQTGLTLQADTATVNYTPSDVTFAPIDRIIDSDVARYTITGADLVFTLAENPDQKIFGKKTETNIIKRETTSTLIKNETSTGVIRREDNTDAVEYIQLTYNVRRAS